ncbi:hypothetical protein B9Z41_10165 [Limnohabitans sp. JirII-31]|nr:hypothetical protein B9Z41_10165 [Limnohabitans sp. JirII-31]
MRKQPPPWHLQLKLLQSSPLHSLWLKQLQQKLLNYLLIRLPHLLSKMRLLRWLQMQKHSRLHHWQM